MNSSIRLLFLAPIILVTSSANIREVFRANKNMNVFWGKSWESVDRGSLDRISLDRIS
jgi:hypothetical protein